MATSSLIVVTMPSSDVMAACSARWPFGRSFAPFYNPLVTHSLEVTRGRAWLPDAVQVMGQAAVGMSKVNKEG